MLPLLLAWLHAVNDLFSNFLTPLLPKLMAHFGVGLGTVGLLVSAYSLTGSLLQPLAGLIADRSDRRLLAALGPVLVALGMGSLGLWPRFEVLLGVLLLAGMGSALFHASGASLVGEFAPGDRRGFWLSFFGSAGYLGLSLGPIVALFAVGAWGLEGLIWLTPLALLPALALLRLPPVRRQGRPAGFRDFLRVFRGDVARLWGMATLRSLVFMSFSTTLPYWYAQKGLSDAYTAFSLSVYSFSATLGAFLGGTLSDRFGRQRVLVGTLAFGLPLYLALLLFPPENPLYLLLLAVTGALMNAGIPVAVAMAQELEPTQTATVSGLLMGFTWGFAGLFYAPIGHLIEALGVMPVLLALGVLILPAWALARAVREPWARRA
ncbi:MAG: MFS transporter [Thermus sp.]|uniref:MFS transporter n=1 Tax=Thermus sp. TaxID=275 RepID=UPI0025FA91CA|nr:MFS transporter [Thermus sp.]MCS6867594.1 MFS transporter [Thermus sp.]MCS7217754.1 MFS transporter [Thermus sp.]MCX7849542.1 MFS transporter [Thermus sp.]MDW8016570.1 MFS transporter [Thermus sp.]MDW8357573.1 MFS transporter [Thermus sp.]